MAEPTLSTSVSPPSMAAVSRRAMLVGGAGALALPAVPLAAVAGPTAAGGAGLDAGLLRRIGEAYGCLAAYRRADAVCVRLHREVGRHPEFPEGMPTTPAECERWDALMERAGIPAADARCERRYEAYVAALGAVFAHTLAGVHGKLRLAVVAVKQDQSIGFDEVDCTYLDGTLADLARLAAPGRAPGRSGPAA